eukprot:784005-Rhodomonas_salina.1
MSFGAIPNSHSAARRRKILVQIASKRAGADGRSADLMSRMSLSTMVGSLFSPRATRTASSCREHAPHHTPGTREGTRARMWA